MTSWRRTTFWSQKRKCHGMEHIIASSLTKHFDRHNILYDIQHGFQERRSCETQLIKLVEDLARNLTSGTQTDLILFDFSIWLGKSPQTAFHPFL